MHSYLERWMHVSKSPFHKHSILGPTRLTEMKYNSNYNILHDDIIKIYLSHFKIMQYKIFICNINICDNFGIREHLMIRCLLETYMVDFGGYKYY